jgi:hypothetical protein
LRDQGFDATIIKWILVEDYTALKWLRIKFGVGKFLDNRAVGIATGDGPDDQGIGVRVPVGQEFSLLHVIETGSVGHPTSYPVGTGALFPGVKRTGLEADHSPPSNAEVRKMCVYTFPPPFFALMNL